MSKRTCHAAEFGHYQCVAFPKVAHQCIPPRPIHPGSRSLVLKYLLAVALQKRIDPPLQVLPYIAHSVIAHQRRMLFFSHSALNYNIDIEYTL